MKAVTAGRPDKQHGDGRAHRAPGGATLLGCSATALSIAVSPPSGCRCGGSLIHPALGFRIGQDRNMLTRVLLGSPSLQLISHASCDVLSSVRKAKVQLPMVVADSRFKNEVSAGGDVKPTVQFAVRSGRLGGLFVAILEGL